MWRPKNPTLTSPEVVSETLPVLTTEPGRGKLHVGVAKIFIFCPGDPCQKLREDLWTFQITHRGIGHILEANSKSPRQIISVLDDTSKPNSDRLKVPYRCKPLPQSHNNISTSSRDTNNYPLTKFSCNHGHVLKQSCVPRKYAPPNILNIRLDSAIPTALPKVFWASLTASPPVVMCETMASPSNDNGDCGSNNGEGESPCKLPPLGKPESTPRSSRTMTRRRRKRDRHRKKTDEVESKESILQDTSEVVDVADTDSEDKISEKCRFPILPSADTVNSNATKKRAWSNCDCGLHLERKTSNLSAMALTFRNSVEQLYLDTDPAEDGKAKLDRLLSESVLVDESSYDAFARCHRPEKQDSRNETKALYTPRTFRPKPVSRPKPRYRREHFTLEGISKPISKEPTLHCENANLPKKTPQTNRPQDIEVINETETPKCSGDAPKSTSANMESNFGRLTGTTIFYNRERSLTRPRHSKLHIALSRT